MKVKHKYYREEHKHKGLRQGKEEIQKGRLIMRGTIYQVGKKLGDLKGQVENEKYKGVTRMIKSKSIVSKVEIESLRKAGKIKVNEEVCKRKNKKVSVMDMVGIELDYTKILKLRRRGVGIVTKGREM